ncbi:MAG TPA: hypothetical protein VGB78_00910 [Thermoplasmata archaeon]|jgi:hypothetical protein
MLLYVRAREKMLADRGKLFSESLLRRKDDPNAFYSANRLRSIKAKVEQLSGVRFELRSLGRTYGQMLLDNDADLEVASLALGQKNAKPSQRWFDKEKGVSVLNASQVTV